MLIEECGQVLSERMEIQTERIFFNIFSVSEAAPCADILYIYTLVLHFLKLKPNEFDERERRFSLIRLTDDVMPDSDPPHTVSV